MKNLTYENEWIRAKLSSVEEVPILYFGNEEEFFPNEIKDVVLDALEEKLKNSDENSRRADVLRDILDKNGKCKHIADKKAQKLKQELKGDKNVSKSMRRMLSEMGFIIEEEGKHYKLIYYGDLDIGQRLLKLQAIFIQEKMKH